MPQLNDSLKIELISALNTFVATFIGTVGVTLSAGSIQWSTAFWGSLALVAVRAAVKAVTATWISQRLGGRA